MTNARKTIESSILIALADTSLETGMTISKSKNLVDALIKEIFDRSVRWSVREYLKEVEKEASS